MRDDTLRQEIGAMLTEILAVLGTPQIPEPDLYYRTSARVAVQADHDEATFTVSLVHEPISDEAAVEQDRFAFRLSADGFDDLVWETGLTPRSLRGAPFSDQGHDQLLAHVRRFVDENWRG
jgi:hypothetical protein